MVCQNTCDHFHNENTHPYVTSTNIVINDNQITKQTTKQQFSDDTIARPETVPLLSGRQQSSIIESNENVKKGYFLMLFSTIGFSTMAILERLAQTRYHLNNTNTLFIRGIVQAIFATIALPLMTDVQSQWRLPSRIKLFVLIRGLIGTLAVILHLLSLRYIPAGDAIAIYFTSPIFTMIFAALFLREPITPTHGIAAFLSILGGLIVTSPGASNSEHLNHNHIDHISSTHRLIGSVCAMSASVLSALVYIILRKIGLTIHFMTSVFSLGICVTIVSIGIAATTNSMTWTQSDTPGVITMFCAALFACCGQVGINKGIQLCPAGPGALIRNIDVPLVYLLGIVWLHEIPTLFRAFGATLVVFSALLVALRKGN